MKVPSLDLKQQYAELKNELLDRIGRLIDSGGYILGPEVEAFESEIAAYLGVKYAVGVTSGTDALLVSLKALGVVSGDKVLTSPFTFFATISAIVSAGAEPVFADIQPDTFNLDPARVEQALEADGSRKIKAMIPVHVYGQSADMTKLMALADRRGIPVVEDAAQAIGASFEGRPVGSFGRFGCFSFFPTKNLGGIGDGGLITSNDADLADAARLIRNHGASRRYYHDTLGGNYRLDAIQAAALRLFLPRLMEWGAARRSAAEHYDREIGALGTAYLVPFRGDGATHVFHQYTIRVTRGSRDALQAFLREQGIESSVYYPVPCHLQKALEKLGEERGMFPVAEAAAREVLSLPIFPGITIEQQDYVVAKLAAFQGSL